MSGHSPILLVYIILFQEVFKTAHCVTENVFENSFIFEFLLCLFIVNNGSRTFWGGRGERASPSEFVSMTCTGKVNNVLEASSVRITSLFIVIKTVELF